REVNFADYGMQLSRTSHAIKVWLSVQYFGLAAFREAIDRCIDLAQHAEERIRRSDRLELLSPASLGIVCFRRRTDGSEDEVERVARIARQVRFPAGAAIVEQWEVGREFYAIVDGTARVFKDGKEIAEMRRGDYFGELAALEWGASFSYPRLATVLATTDVRALVLPGPFFNELV